MNTLVNFELAKLLKEKGFDESCMKCYAEERLIDKKNGGDLFTGVYRLCDRSRFHKKYYLAPTIAEAVMWLYEKHGIWIVVETALGEDVKCLFSWYCTDDEQNILCSDFDYTADSKYHHKSPTEAYKAAIEYTLKNLIQ